MIEISFVPFEEFQRVRQSALEPHARLALVADMCRANALAAVKRAGSGHIGSSFSAMDIVVWLYEREMNTLRVGLDHPDRDVFFSSKGHDCPGQYAVLHAVGVIPEEKLLALRRLGGLDGHPDVKSPGIEANSGSLGMGISKGRGIAWAKRYRGHSGHVFVMTGDGELQEGQNFEAFQAGLQQGVAGMTVIVDHNELQTDKPVRDIVDLGDLEAKLRSFGWQVLRCEGHDFSRLEQAFAELRRLADRPKVLIADTIKGRGVSFMEHPQALRDGGGLYRWHAGAPDDDSFRRAWSELRSRIDARLSEAGLAPLCLKAVPPEDAPALNVDLGGEQDSRIPGPAVKARAESVAEVYGQELLRIASERDDVVILDGDLSADCRVRPFELAHPARFIENGIAEQDMVSMAGGLARQGLIPVVNSFASFLVSRANEQIYNNASEGTRIVYACHYAGLLPAGPGKSHQSIRDISLLGALPNMTIVQPCNGEEARQATRYCVEQARESCALRLIIGPSPRVIPLPDGYRLTPGQGVGLTDGADALLFGYGPATLHEALLAAERLRQHGFGLRVVNLPWLNRVDGEWLAATLGPYREVFVVEDHAPVGGLADHLLRVIAGRSLHEGRRLTTFAVEGWPAMGTPPQVLRHHRLDGASLAERILAACASGRAPAC